MKHSELRAKVLSAVKVQVAYDEMAPEFSLLRQILCAREKDALSQAEIAGRMGRKPLVTKFVE